MKSLLRYHWYLSMLWCLGLGCSSKTQREGGVAVSFDDRFIAEWHSLRPLFKDYSARVTLYINGDTLTAEQISMLRDLQSDGHEIGFHGTIHGDAKQLLDTYGPEGYDSMEVSPGLSFLNRQGFSPTSYAHPGGTYTSRTDSVLVSKGLIKLRRVSKNERYYKGRKLYHLPPAWMPHIYYDFDGRTSVYALQIDRETEISRDEIEAAIEKAVRDGTVLVLFGHQPLTPDASSEKYGFDINFLKTILEACRGHGAKFYTMSELE